MRELTRAGLGITVDFAGTRHFHVDPPTVRQALVVLSAIRGEKIADEDRRLLRETTAEWFGLRLHSIVWGTETFRSEAYRWKLLVRLVREPIPDSVLPDVQEEGEEAVQEDAKLKPPRWWWQQVTRYRARFGLSAEKVMTEPWPEFVVARGELGTLEARDTQRVMRGTLAADPRAETSDLVEWIRGAARLEGEEVSASDSPPVESPSGDTPPSSEEHLEKQLAKLPVATQNL
jgi:hypothetical protein